MTEHQLELGPVSEAVVTDSIRISREDLDEVRRIRLRIDDPSFHFSVGQSVGVVAPGPHPFGNRYHMRRYSIAGEASTAAAEPRSNCWCDAVLRSMR